jgi:GT2 family glycosyltransferase/glycosyltransferase involved in cell wall biosynthesis
MTTTKAWLQEIAGAAKLLTDILGLSERQARSEELRLIRASGLFDSNWYSEKVAAVREQGLDPVEHYLLIGDRIGQRPHPLFDSQYYRALCPESNTSGYSALGHFLKVGGLAMLSPTALFDVQWYVSQNPDVDLPNGIAAFHHFLTIGGPEGRAPSPLFDTERYLISRPNLRGTGVNLLTHFVEVGAKEGVSPHWLFDTGWYLATNPDCTQGGRDPLSHFLISGAKDGANPHPLFCTDWYWSQADSSTDGEKNPLLHYLTVGAKLGLSPHPCFDVAWYTSVYTEVAIEKHNPLEHYILSGAARGYFPNPHFDSAWYVGRNPIAGTPGYNPLAHYLSWPNSRPSISFDPDWYSRQTPAAQTHPGGPFGHFLEARKKGWVQGNAEQRCLWHETIDMDVYNASKNCLTNYRYSIGDLTHDALAAEATRHDREIYNSNLKLLIERLSDLRVPRDDHPKVSVIIPVFNGIHFTLACLQSIAQCPPNASIEVIVADNQSDDLTRELLEPRSDIRYVRNPTNLGFLRSCNRAATFARGEYIFLLNNDTMVCPGWLDELLTTFSLIPNVGLAGSRLLFADGRLQEAGGIIWNDGSAWNFGRGGDPGDPRYSYLRPADYISACTIMVPKKVWDQMSGFDEMFVPSYCEDSDLALRIRKAGFAVIYQPLSTVVHFEGMTQGRDETKGIKAYQTVNTVKLRTRWVDYLKTLQTPGEDLDRAISRGLGRRALVLDNCTPEPDKDAGSVTALNLMLLLRDSGFAVTFIPQDNFLYLPGYTANLQRNGIEVIYGHYCSSVEQHLKEAEDRYDLVVLFRPDSWEKHSQAVRRLSPRAKLLYHTCDLHFLRVEREVAVKEDLSLVERARQLKIVELDALRNSDLTIVHSVAEADIVKSLVPATSVAVFPWAIPVPGTQVGFTLRRNLVFVGGYQHVPNVDAVIYFVREIFPLIRARIPDVRLLVVGSKPPRELLELASPSVEIIGYVADLTSVLDRARLSIAPLRYGAGIKGKIATAMSLGLPTVATTIAAEGMALTHGEDVLVADAPEDFAEQVVKAYSDRSLWEKLSNQGIEFARDTYGPMAAWRVFTNILDQVNLPLDGEVSVPRLISPSDGKVSRTANLSTLGPAAVLTSRSDYDKFRESYAFDRVTAQENRWIEAIGDKAGTIVAFSSVAGQFVVLEPSQSKEDIALGELNLICPATQLSTGEQLLATLVRQAAAGNQTPLIFLNDDASPLYRWASTEFGGKQIVTPWKLDERYGQERFDVIASFRWLHKHPDPATGLLEFARVLKAGGQLLTIQHIDLDLDDAVAVGPMMNNSSGVMPAFLKFGWDLLANAQAGGFSEVKLELYHSFDYGFVGRFHSILRCVK